MLSVGLSLHWKFNKIDISILEQVEITNSSLYFVLNTCHFDFNESFQQMNRIENGDAVIVTKAGVNKLGSHAFTLAEMFCEI